MITNTHRQSFEANLIDNVPALLDISMQWIAGNISPEDLYHKDRLEKWAEENGYTKENN